MRGPDAFTGCGPGIHPLRRPQAEAADALGKVFRDTAARSAWLTVDPYPGLEDYRSGQP